MKTKGFLEGARYSIERFHLSDTPEAIVLEWNAMAEEAYRHHLRLKPGAKAYLTALKKRGIPIALATVSPPQFYRPALTAGQVMELFDILADASIVGGKKDGPALYLHVAKRLGAEPSRCLVFEDTLHAMRGALQGGFLTCAVYDPSSEAQWEQMCREAHFILTDFEKGLQKTGSASPLEHNT